MRAVLQRVLWASVGVGGTERARIGRGLLVLVGIADTDTGEQVAWMAEKVAHLRVFEDEAGKMNRSVIDLAGAPDQSGGETRPGVLLVPNFTLAGEARKGRRPSFDRAMRPEDAEPMFGRLVEGVRGLTGAGVDVRTGVFRAEMRVELANDGPVTIVLDAPGSGGER